MFRRRTRPRGCFFRDGCIHASHSCGSCGFCSSDRAALLSSAVQLLLFNCLPRRPCSPLFRPSCFLPALPPPPGAPFFLTSPLFSLYLPHWLSRWFFLGTQFPICRHGSPFYLRPLLFPRPPFLVRCFCFPDLAPVLPLFAALAFLLVLPRRRASRMPPRFSLFLRPLLFSRPSPLGAPASLSSPCFLFFWCLVPLPFRN